MTPKINIYPNYAVMSSAAAGRVIDLMNHKPESVVCFPSGSSPKGMFDALVTANQNGRVDFSKCVFIGLDEWIGLGAGDDGSCRDLLDRDFLKPVGLRDDQVVFFDGKAFDPQAECDRINKIVESLGGLDLIILGVGMNGHLALNEPGTSWDTYAHISELDPVTVEVGQKYFNQPTTLTRGITVGIRHILEARAAILLASGSAKAPVVRRALAFPVSKDFPATVLQNHLNAEFILDAEAAELIS
jgi:glucosamine-6-phosphate isomerase